MAKPENRNGYINDYKREHYDVIRALVPKGKRDEIKACASAEGLTVSQAIVCALEDRYKANFSK